MDRRQFLVASTTGLAGLSTPSLGIPSIAQGMAFPTTTRSGGKAKSTILFFLCGGASHIDMWDLKPDAPREYRGPFLPI